MIFQDMPIKTPVLICLAVAIAAVSFASGFEISAIRSKNFDARKNDMLRKADFEKDSELSIRGCTVFLGDSLINMGQWAEYFPNRKICERGYNGITSAELLPIAETIAPQKAKSVVLLVGINDVMHHVPTEKSCANILQIAAAFKEHDTQVHIITPFPSVKFGKVDIRKGAKALGACLLDKGAEKGFSVHDFAGPLSDDGQLKDTLTIDGVHLNGAGYTTLTDSITKEIRF